ncbi:MAG: TIGR00288 family NYN domain-containing protein [Candidatus Bilamarchaeaceae archaeon]
MFDLSRFFGKKNNIVLLVDGPNTIRKAFHLDLKEIKKEIGKYGEIRTAKVYLDQYASDKLIEAMVNQGFKVVITTGDVDVTMAIEGMEYVLDPNVNIIAFMTRDTDYLPLLHKAKERGKKTIIIATDFAFSAALRNTADIVILFKEKNQVEHIHNS